MIAEWTKDRCEQLLANERAIVELTMVNSSNRFIDRIQEIIELAESLSDNSKGKISFLEFLRVLAVSSREKIRDSKLELSGLSLEILAGTREIEEDDGNGPGRIFCPVCHDSITMRWKDGRRLNSGNDIEHTMICPVRIAREFLEEKSSMAENNTE